MPFYAVATTVVFLSKAREQKAHLSLGFYKADNEDRANEMGVGFVMTELWRNHPGLTIGLQQSIARELATYQVT